MKYKCEVKVAKAEPKWEFPCFAKHEDNEDTILWAYCDLGVGRIAGIAVACAGGLGACGPWGASAWTPIPRADTRGWRVVLDNGGCRLEKGEVAKPVEKTYPWLGSTYDGITVLFLGEKATLAGPGWNTKMEGSITDSWRGGGYSPVAGSVTITNRPGVEFPRLYARGGIGGGVTTMRTAPDVWWAAEGGQLRRYERDSDHWRLEVKPVDVPLPDGSTLTLTFTA